MKQKEYGGYIELDAYSGEEYYPEAWALNSGRAALRLFIRLKEIRKIYLPAFCCDTVREACAAEGILWEYYSVDKDFRPCLSKEHAGNDWVCLVNFYGVFDDGDMQALMRQYPRLIVDYTHAFFRRPINGMNVLYSCRKFFGVPDGAYLVLGEREEGEEEKAEKIEGLQEKEGLSQKDVQQVYETLPQDVSFERMHFLLGRFEAGASPFYQEYAQNNDFFANEPVKRMSKLTHNLLRAVDYPRVCGQRTENFAFLHRQLKEKNVLNLPPAIQGAYAYPFWFNGDKISGKEIRRRLIAQQIYIPMLWPEVCSLAEASPLERQMTENILPLPVDQRYNREDMEEILGCLLRILEG